MCTSSNPSDDTILSISLSTRSGKLLIEQKKRPNRPLSKNQLLESCRNNTPTTEPAQQRVGRPRFPRRSVFYVVGRGRHTSVVNQRYAAYRCVRRGIDGKAPRRKRCGTSLRSVNAAADASPPATRRAGAGCGRSAALLVVDDATASPPPRALHLGRKRHQRSAAYL